MALTVNTNVASLTSQRNLGGSQELLKTSLERLSTGLRINSAKDDAAGLAISERFTAQIKGLEPGRAERQRWYFTGSDGRRRVGGSDQQPAAHSRAGGSGVQCNQYGR